MQVKNQTSKHYWIVISILVVYATAFAPLVSDDQRNYLTILVSFIAAAISFPIMMRRRQPRDTIWIAAVISNLLIVTSLVGTSSDFSTVGYTGLFSITYFLFANSLYKGAIAREKIINLLKWIIYAYCTTSVMQMTASLVGLPIPNLILSKGLWSYNSLAVEPSHAGRALAATMLAYLILTQPESGSYNLYSLLRNHTRILAAFIISILLTGSSLALISAPLVILLALRVQWIIVLSILIVISFPVLLTIDSPSLQRSLSFITVFPSMDIMTLVEADQSGAMRIMPLLIYIEKVDFFSLGFFLGEGIGAISRYVQGELIGAGDLIATGFIPGYIMAFGLIGIFLFVFSFIIRFLNITTLPFIVLWISLFIFSAWNSQLFWYGLMLIRIIYYFSFFESVKQLQSNKRNAL